jgi:hypothetical protein
MSWASESVMREAERLMNGSCIFADAGVRHFFHLPCPSIGSYHVGKTHAHAKEVDRRRFDAPRVMKAARARREHKHSHSIRVGAFLGEVQPALLRRLRYPVGTALPDQRLYYFVPPCTLIRRLRVFTGEFGHTPSHDRITYSRLNVHRLDNS